jgi:hypothetical protein
VSKVDSRKRLLGGIGMLFTRRSVLQLAVFAGIAATTVGLVSATLAGGFGIFVHLPGPNDDPRVKDAVLVAQVGGCHGPGSSVVITAEGMVNGKRITKTLTPIDVTPTDKEIPFPTFGIRREWPNEGKWVISITGIGQPWNYPDMKNNKPTGKLLSARPTIVALVPISPDGTPEIRATPVTKGDREVNVIRIGKADREKTIARLLTPRDMRIAGAVKR